MKIDDLLKELTAALVGYHQAQSFATPMFQSVDREKILLYVQLLLLGHDYNDKLEEIASEFVQKEREPLVRFLVHEIRYLKSCKDRTTAYDEDELKFHANQIGGLLKDCKKLLSTYQNAPHSVTYSKPLLTEDASEVKISLLGLKSTKRLGWAEFCASGTFLIEVLKGLKLSIDSTDEALDEFAKQLCREHQASLPEKQQIHVEQPKIDPEVESLKDEAEKQKLIIVSLTEDNKSLKDENEKQKLMLASLTEDSEKLAQEKQQLTDENAKLKEENQKILREHQRQIAPSVEAPQGQPSPADDLPRSTDIHNLLGGFGGFGGFGAYGLNGFYRNRLGIPRVQQGKGPDIFNPSPSATE